MKYLKSFGLFWWNFIVGDDWQVAAGVAVALLSTWGLVAAGANPWWLLPVAVVLLLGWSLYRASREAAS